LYMSFSIVHLFFNSYLISFLKKNIKVLAFIIIFSSLAVSITACFVEYLIQKKRKLEEYILYIEQKRLEKGDDPEKSNQLLVTENEKHYVVDHSSIIYISSHGKKSLIHTTDHDYESVQLLKITGEKLPKNKFIRIHKQFIANKHFIKKIEPYTGGRYLMHLRDEDESILTVGRTHVAALKEMLRLK
jgi:DNA-binding LytR/AlgR family response regulator